MNYPHIVAKVYAGIWGIVPERHHAICSVLEARLAGQSAEMPSQKARYEDEDDAPYRRIQGAAVIPVYGVIGKHLGLIEKMCGGCDLDDISDAIEFAEDDDAVDRVVFDINSPGGIVTGTPEVAKQIAEMKKPTAAFGDELIASCAYWLASQCDSIHTTESMRIGSVGVYSIYLDETRAMEMDGVKVNAIVAGKFKLMGASFKGMTDKEREILQADVDRCRDWFRGDVSSRREIDIAQMEGQLFDGRRAVENGYSDGIMGSIFDVLDSMPR